MRSWGGFSPRQGGDSEAKWNSVLDGSDDHFELMSIDVRVLGEKSVEDKKGGRSCGLD